MTLDGVKVTLVRVSGSKHFLEVAVPDGASRPPRGTEPVPARETEETGGGSHGEGEKKRRRAMLCLGCDRG